MWNTTHRSTYPFVGRTQEKSPRGGGLGVIPLRFERRTYCLEGSCSIQLSYGTAFVGTPRFELGISCSQSRRDDRTTLYPECRWGHTPRLRRTPLKRGQKKDASRTSLFFGGEGGIRTPGTLIEYDSLANCWFQPLTHLSVAARFLLKNLCFLSAKSAAKVRTFFDMQKTFFVFCTFQSLISSF